MNKNNKIMMMLTGMLLAAPALYADNGYENYANDDTLASSYIDASGNVIPLPGTGKTQSQDAYSNTAYAPVPPPQPDTDYADSGQNAYAPQQEQEVQYVDAVTGEPLSNEEAQEALAYAANNPSVAHENTRQAEHPQPAQTNNSYAAQPQEPEVLYVDAVTGEPLSGEEAREALAYAANNPSMAYGDTNQAAYPQQPAQPNNNYAAVQQQPEYTVPPMPQDASSGYGMYADTKASKDQVVTPEMAEQNRLAKQARASKATKAIIARAISEGNLDLLRNLHAKGIDLRVPDSQGMTYLHKAAAAGHVEIVKFLLRAGIDPNARTVKDWTPLHHAARFGHGLVVQELLAAGADAQQPNSDGFQPAQLAVNAKKYQVAALLR